jgi:crotonobetainyl-CoA:carnitine CoA-transferase CaiB-like acyl-CoA transferase
MTLAIGNDGQFQKFCKVIDRPDLAADVRFRTNDARVFDRTELIQSSVASRLSARPTRIGEPRSRGCTKRTREHTSLTMS